MSRFLTDRRTVLAGMGATAFGAAAGIAPARAETTEGFLLGVQKMGDENAPVKMIEYASLTCPHCAHYYATVMPGLKKDYIDTGKVQVEYREVYFDRLGLWGGALARSGGADRYFGLISLMFERQDSWTRAENVMDEFLRMGRLAGISDEVIQTNLGSEDNLRALVEMYQSYRDDPRLTGTPTVIINDQKVDNWAYSNLQQILDAAL